jgi:hypothetical protein
MNYSEIFKKVKKATVSLAILHKDKPNRPFTIIGSGFCIHKEGIIVTCEHVVSAFFDKSLAEQIAELGKIDTNKEFIPIKNLKAVTPFVLFYISDLSNDKLFVIPIQVEIAVAKTNYDLGLVRIVKHISFNDGYPTLDVENFDSIYEGMEIGV